MIRLSSSLRLRRDPVNAERVILERLAADQAPQHRPGGPLDARRVDSAKTPSVRWVVVGPFTSGRLALEASLEFVGEDEAGAFGIERVIRAADETDAALVGARDVSSAAVLSGSARLDDGVEFGLEVLLGDLGAYRAFYALRAV